MKRRYTYKNDHEINPDEIFLDSSNLLKFDRHQFEGRMEKPITKKTFIFLGSFFILLSAIFVWKALVLQGLQGSLLQKQSENNRLRQTLILTERGVVFDRNRNELAWNGLFPDTGKEFALREYIQKSGFGHLLGYIQYPAKDTSGFFYQKETEGKAGVESAFDTILRGTNGMKIVETNAFEKKQSESVVKVPVPGQNVTLSIDERVQEKLYEFMEKTARSVGFQGGAGVLMDVREGEILSLVSFPEYDPAVLSLGKDKEKIQNYVNGQGMPFLNRAISGLYTPGSIVKPFLALGALTEGIISPEQKILSTGHISIPNPFIPGEESVFNDWKAHGWVNMRDALAVSSNVYFFEIGGGYENQPGLGIPRIEKYMRLFGFGEKTGVDLTLEEKGLIPNPAWKLKTFNDAWRIGDTYNSAIGQYGFQVTPIQTVRAVAAIANGGVLLTPHIVKSLGSNQSERVSVSPNSVVAYQTSRIAIAPENFAVVREGMREAVLRGTAHGLFIDDIVPLAAKTGTAELGALKQYVNSWVIGFFPYENPRFAFSIVMEHGPRDNLIGALYVARQLFEWMAVNTPEYLRD